ncbi:TetR/AcrR family transcriptional regulator [Vibrio tapetis subsp. quintayensis]|uniref:TetR/AcrR family transcriptional regulator n=1 Tax=Vibrio tapetis TaxID=52443 RepID=UPI0025B5CFCA|nr:TetR/AcrR family transcriptional regulator [Vibrio tapetis]MDN3680905.1 TetR/AcrR family transcriptional regulator [Vibrio tapetis subsp. quintayensis]
MSKIEENREKKKQAILAAAKSVFLSEGYTSTGMDAVAAQAKLTKQTLYRYFPSKSELFQATLKQIGESYTDRYSQHLALESTRDALIAFATEFMRFHLSQEHIATQRLLIIEANQDPEILTIFMGIAPDDTNAALNVFFAERFNLQQPNTKIELWLGMLLAPRSRALLGTPVLNDQQIEKHAMEATDLLLFGIQ